MHATSVAGTEPGQRRLNGPQTTGRTYRNLSQPRHAIAAHLDVAVPMRDGVELLADVFRPDGAAGPVPALIAASCYPRQIQNLGAPMGFVEAGATDFWVPRGYAHVIANVRGTGGSGGTYGFLDQTEREDMHDLVEWVAAQPWCDGRVGMIGISYFAMTQLAAATQRPAHLRALFPVATTADLYEAVYHHGLFSATFINGWLSGVGMLADKPNDAFRGRLAKVAERILHAPPVHRRFEHLNGEAALAVLSSLMRGGFDADPFGDLWLAAAVEHPTRDAFWAQRDLRPELEGLDLPVYLGCDWENVPLHLPSTFTVWEILQRAGAPVRMGMLGKDGLTWPWESLHVEALAWFDHWLKDADTGVMDGPPVRYQVPGADGFREAATWPPPDAAHVAYALRADGTLATDEGPAGARRYAYLPATIGRVKGAPAPPLPPALVWDTAPLAEALDVAGELELRLEADTTAVDTAWIVTIQDVDPSGAAVDVTAGWLRASCRAVDEEASRPGAPFLPGRELLPVPPGETVRYRIPLVPNARRFDVGHRLRLVLASDDVDPSLPAVMRFRHAPLGEAAVNTVHSGSRLLLPVLTDQRSEGGRDG
jgi:putative CocE/NonD family hydrolase